MIGAFGLYGKLLRPWLTVVVYLWILELIASFSFSDPEPLIDQLADCSAILATLVFWTANRDVAALARSAYFPARIDFGVKC